MELIGDPDTESTKEIRKDTTYFNKDSEVDNTRCSPQKQRRLCQWEL